MKDIKIEYIDINKIIPYENNPRNNEEAVPYVVKSIEKFGFNNPIIIDKDNIIVCGHTRYEAAKELGYKEIPCIRADDLNEEQIKAFRLADNKVAESSEWNYLKLQEELKQILEIDMNDFGFLDIELDGEETTSNLNKKIDEVVYFECPSCHKYIPEKEIICK